MPPVPAPLSLDALDSLLAAYDAHVPEAYRGWDVSELGDPTGYGSFAPPVAAWMAAALNAAPALVSELRAAREALAWWNLCADRSEWFRNDGRTHLAMLVHDGADLSCRAMREDAMRLTLSRAATGGAS